MRIRFLPAVTPLALALVFVLTGGSAQGIVYLDAIHGYVALNKGNQGRYDQVGAVRIFDDDGEFQGHGSGTLITVPGLPVGPTQWVLTAAHVVVDAPSIRFTMGRDFDNPNSAIDFIADSWYIPSSYDGNVISESDIALIRLVEAPGQFGKTIYPHDDLREVGSVYHTVGYGTSGTGITALDGDLNNDGRKRSGRNEYDYVMGLNNAIIMSDFDIDYNRDRYGLLAPGEPNREWRIAREVSNAPGDSGGPQFIGDNIVSITSFGTVPVVFNIDFGNLRTAPWAQWIEDVIDDVEFGGGDGSTVASGIFGDSAVQGSSGNAINLLAGAGGSSSNFQYYSELLIRHFDPDDPMDDFNDVMRMLGLSKRAEVIDEIEAGLRLEKYGFDTSNTSATAVLEFAKEKLTWSLGQLDASFVDLKGQELGHYGFLFGLAPAATWAPMAPGADVLPVLPGDANLDGKVDLQDLLILAAHWQVEGDENALSNEANFIDWYSGDFNFDDVVDEFDLAILAANWLRTIEGDTLEGPTFAEALAIANIPEPASLMLLGLAGAALAIRRR